MQKDAEYNDSHFDFNTSDKRTVRVAVKKYEKNWQLYKLQVIQT